MSRQSKQSKRTKQNNCCRKKYFLFRRQLPYSLIALALAAPSFDRFGAYSLRQMAAHRQRAVQSVQLRLPSVKLQKVYLQERELHFNSNSTTIITILLNALENRKNMAGEAQHNKYSGSCNGVDAR
jgi:hypothetical protein